MVFPMTAAAMSNDAEVRAREAAKAIMAQSLYRIWPADAEDNITAGLLAFAAEARSHDGEWEAMRGALEPFATLGRLLNGKFEEVLFQDDKPIDGLPWSENGKCFTILYGDLRRAHRVLSAVPLFDEGRL